MAHENLLQAARAATYVADVVSITKKPAYILNHVLYSYIHHFFHLYDLFRLMINNAI